MKAGTGEKKKSYAILASAAGIFLIALSLSGDDTAGSQGLGGISAPYHGSSGWLQVTFQHPVMRDGKHIGDVTRTGS